MNEDDLKQRVDTIIDAGDDDPEESHWEEDNLLRDLIRAHCPDWAVEQVERLLNAELTRWYA